MADHYLVGEADGHALVARRLPLQARETSWSSSLSAGPARLRQQGHIGRNYRERS
jgi:hypothetical protein